ncbi:Stress-activated protein kinase JNK [Aphelenchoides bicaudatus]|nr:Stress-activated protein kinase JNK [Aphelenchoides bicaudatus]
MINNKNVKFKIQSIDGYRFVMPDRYTLVESCMVSGQASVIKADDERTKTKVVIKKIDLNFKEVPELRAKHAFRELVLLGMTNHENVIKLLNAYTPDKDVESFTYLYLVMPCTTTTLHDRLALNETFTYTKINYLIYKLAVGISYLHSAGIVHRDLKPGNIGIDINDEPIIFDFGLSRLISNAAMSGPVGTFVYMAPEILLKLDFSNEHTKCDMFSLGCIWAEMINRKRLWIMIGSAEDHFLNIFKKLGPVDDDFIKELTPDLKKRVKKIRFTSLNRLTPAISFREPMHKNDVNDIRETIMMTLQISPKQRWSANELLAKFEQRNWNSNDKMENKLKGSDVFQKACREAKGGNKTWKELLFDKIKQYEKENDIFGHQLIEPPQNDANLPGTSKLPQNNANLPGTSKPPQNNANLPGTSKPPQSNAKEVLPNTVKPSRTKVTNLRNLFEHLVQPNGPLNMLKHTRNMGKHLQNMFNLPLYLISPPPNSAKRPHYVNKPPKNDENLPGTSKPPQNDIRSPQHVNTPPPIKPPQNDTRSPQHANKPPQNNANLPGTSKPPQNNANLPGTPKPPQHLNKRPQNRIEFLRQICESVTQNSVGVLTEYFESLTKNNSPHPQNPKKPSKK